MCASVFNFKAGFCDCFFARIACGDVASELLSDTFLLAARSESLGG